MEERPQTTASCDAAVTECKKEKNLTLLWLGLALWLGGAVPEAILHIATAQNAQTMWNEGLLLGILFSLVPAAVLMGLVMLLPWRKVNFGIALGYSILMVALCVSQLIYYRVFGCFYSAYSMANGGQILQFWNIILKKFFGNLLWIFAMAIPLVLLCIFRKKILPEKAVQPKWFSAFPVAAAVILQIVLVMALPCFGGTGDMTPYDLYHKNADSYYSVNRLGLATAFRLDVTRRLTGQQVDSGIQLENPDLTFPLETKPTAPKPTEGTVGGPTDETGTVATVPTEPPIDTSPNVLDIDFDGLIANESNASIVEMHKYFQNRTPTNKNEYTGMFEGYNLVMITAEAFSYLAVDEERTPMLYKMMTEGFQFTNYYVPDWGASTTDGEYAHLTGTIPKPNVWSFYESSKNAMPLTMSEQLIERGYNAYAYHGHFYDYYKRNEYLTNIGFYYKGYGGDSYGKGNGLPIDYHWPESDVQVVDVSTGDFATQEPFVAYYMSISGHREFTFWGNTIARKNQDLVADEPYSENVRAYLACQLELELSLQLLVQRLEEAGTLDRTVFVITADHYPNGLTVEEMSELAGHDIETNFELYKNALMIWTPGMTSVTVDTACSHLDVLPTLSNLFGFEYDSRLYMGRDVFSDSPAMVIFLDRSWITDYASYNYTTGEVIALTDTPVPEEYVKAVKTEVANRFTVSSRILDYDYWRILFGD